ncbi:ATP-binding cassette domain-containing protein [Escherichia coli]
MTFSLHKGEVIGIYGLLGAGRTELFKGLVGLMPCQSGKIQLNGETIDKCHFQARLKRAGVGARRSPGRRRRSDDVDSVQYDAIRFQPARFSPCLEMAESAKESASVKEMILQLAIKVSDAELPITSLSGGNQQKWYLAKR